MERLQPSVIGMATLYAGTRYELDGHILRFLSRQLAKGGDWTVQRVQENSTFEIIGSCESQ